MAWLKTHIYSLTRKYNYPYTVLCFLLLFLTLEGVAVLERSQEDTHENDRLNMVALTSSQLIYREVFRGLNNASILASLIKADDFNTDHFEQWAKSLIQANPIVGILEIEQAGKISHIHPLQGREFLLGRSAYPSKTLVKQHLYPDRKNAIITYGPVRLKEDNSLALFGYHSIFKQQGDSLNFWGSAIVVIHLQELLKSMQEYFSANNVEYSIHTRDKSGKSVHFIGKRGLDKDPNSFMYELSIPGNSWHLFMQRKESNPIYYAYYIFGLLFSLLGARFVFNIEKKTKMQRIKLRALNRKLQKQASADPLTKLLNRRATMELAQVALTECNSHQQPFSLAYIDLDHFKFINDQFGHKIGDEVLIRFTNVCLSQLQSTDILSRWGGEEFVLFMPNRDLDSAEVLAESIRSAVEAECIDIGLQDISISVSIGLATSYSSNLDQLLQASDKAMYHAKSSGRNRIEIAEPFDQSLA